MTPRCTLFLLIFLATSSCTIQKRLYSRGFHIESRKHIRLTPGTREDYFQLSGTAPEKQTEEVSMDSLQNTCETHPSEPGSIPVTITDTQSILSFDLTPKTSRKNQLTDKLVKSVSTETKLYESGIHSKINQVKNKHSSSGRGDIDWGEVLDWILIVAGIVGAVFLLAAIPGVSFAQALLSILLVVLFIILLAVLISNALGNVEWFWSGR